MINVSYESDTGLQQMEYYKRVLAGDIFRDAELKEKDMKELQGEYVTVFYEKEESAAKDVFDLAEKESLRLATSLGFTEPLKINVYVYDDQETFHSKKCGVLAGLLDLGWYIGDNRGTDVLLLSPASFAQTHHNYNSIKNAVVHEMVHAYNSVLNSNMELWFNEGLAVYLANQKPNEDFYKYFSFPRLCQLHTTNNLDFADIGGYEFSYCFFDYLSEKYGFEKALQLAKTSDYEGIFEKSEEEIYNEWKNEFAVTWMGKNGDAVK